MENAHRLGDNPSTIGRKKMRVMAPHEYVPVSNMWSLQVWISQKFLNIKIVNFFSSVC